MALRVFGLQSGLFGIAKHATVKELDFLPTFFNITISARDSLN
jgi:hypothetical protein